MNHDLTIGSHSGGIIKAIRYGYDEPKFIVSCWSLQPIQEDDTVTLSAMKDDGPGTVLAIVRECEWVWDEFREPMYIAKLEVLP